MTCRGDMVDVDCVDDIPIWVEALYIDPVIEDSKNNVLLVSNEVVTDGKIDVVVW